MTQESLEEAIYSALIPAFDAAISYGAAIALCKSERTPQSRAEENSARAQWGDVRAEAVGKLVAMMSSPSLPVGVSEDIVQRIASRLEGRHELSPFSARDLEMVIRKVLVAALPLAKPVSEIERGVVGRLAEKASTRSVVTPAKGEITISYSSGSGSGTCEPLSDWLRSQINTEGE